MQKVKILESNDGILFKILEQKEFWQKNMLIEI
jgi:hypothetical protein